MLLEAAEVVFIMRYTVRIALLGMLALVAYGAIHVVTRQGNPAVQEAALTWGSWA